MASHKLWKRLKEVSGLEYTSTCRKIPPSYDRRKGAGKVITKENGDEVITFFEKGKWRGVQASSEVAFTNVFRWRFDAQKNRISLEHLRFGLENPVFIFHLTPIGENLLKSLSPHECKEDTYFGSVLFDEHYIHLNWRIVGPKKNEMVSMTYF